MLLRHRLAALIWAAAFVVAAQFVAGSAFAHAGHSHPHHHHSSAVHVPAEQAHQHGVAAGEIRHAELHQSGKMFAAAAVLPDHNVCAPSGCAGSCCSVGTGCCGAALAGTFSALPDMRPVKDIASIIFVRRSGIDPEALARPPRSLA